MESKVYSSKIQEYQNQNVKQCPSCNMILPLSEYDDHMFCHELDQGENGIGAYNINNFNIAQNNINNNNNNQNNCPPPPLQTLNNNNNNININNSNQNNNNNIYPSLEEINNNNHINENNDTQNNNHINCINDNNPPSNNNSNNNINPPKKEDKKSNEPESDNFFSKISNYFSSVVSKAKDEEKSDNSKKEPEKKIDFNSLSEEERQKYFAEEEKKAYEKKILGLIDESDKKKTLTEKIGDNVENLFGTPTEILFGAIDLVGCFFRVGPSIARTAIRAGNLINRSITTFSSDNNSFNGSIKKKNKDVQAIINCLPTTIVKEKKEHDSNNNCVICMSDFEPGEKISTLPCAHVFHTECIDDWIKREPTCPVCKFKLTLDSIVGNNVEEAH